MRFTVEERELNRQKVIFYVWEKYLTSECLLTPKLIAEKIGVPKTTVVKVLKNENLFCKINNHNKLLRKKQLKHFQ